MATSAATEATSPSAPPRDHWRGVWRVTGWGLAAALLIAAAGVAVREVDWAVLGEASPWALAALALAVVGNLILTSLLFWVVTRSFDAEPRVSVSRMTALIAASHLLNYLPLIRAGLVGRAAYLKAKHALPVRQSAVILAVILVLAVVVFTAAALALLTVPTDWRWGTLLVLWVVLALMTGSVARRLLRRPVVWGWSWVVLRAADLLVSAFRLWVAFAVMGMPIGYTEAVVIGAAGLLVRLIGLTPNGLGLSEWVVAGLAAALTPVSTAAGAAAALLDRAVEVAVTSVTGLIAMGWLRG